MKSNLRVAVLLTIWAASTPLAFAEAAWPITLLDEPFHVGDTVIKTMAHPQPQGRTLERTFVVPEGIPPSYLYVIVWVSDMIPKTHRELKKGFYQNELRINGETVGILNKRVDPPEGPTVQKIVVQVKGSALHPGTNALAIRAGALGGNLDDFEVHKIVIDTKR